MTYCRVPFAAAVVGAEAAFTGLNTKPETPGRPEITSTLVGIGGTVAVSWLRIGASRALLA